MLLFLQCVKEYNPFSDASNARVHILRPSDAITTLPIFTTDTVELLFTVCNLIEKVSVVAEKNRYFDSKVYKNPCEYGGETILLVSFYDTGFQEIKVVTELKTGESTVDRRRYYVVSQLQQDDINGNYGSALKLEAKSNNQDRDVKYIWKISEKEKKSVHDTASISIVESLLSDSGSLQMCDYQELYCSPPVYFKISLSDTVKPKIIILNPYSNDTIYVPGDTLLLLLKVESVSENTVYANGRMMTGIGSKYFIDTIRRADSEQAMSIEILAKDKYNNDSDKRMNIVFKSTIQQNIRPHIEIIGFPGDDVVLQKSYQLSGRVVFNANSEVKYTVVLIDGKRPDVSQTNSGTKTFEWRFTLNLDDEHNFYRIEVRDTLSNVVEDTTVHIRYCANCVDTVPPVIASVLVNKDTLSSIYRYTSTSSRVSIELICFDLGSGVDSVLLGNSMMSQDPSVNYRWVVDRDVSHILRPDTLTFRAVDSNGISSDEMSIVIGYNTPPYIWKAPDVIRYAFIGTVFTDTVAIVDKDPDDYVKYSVMVGKLPVKNGDELFVDDNGEISWKPKNSDLGFKIITVTGTDRNGAQVSWNDTVYVSNVALDTIRFLTTGQEFPKTLSCTDSLIVPLRVTGGTRPFLFEIRNITTKNSIKINSNDTVFRWKPDRVEEAVYYQFFIVVRDTLRLADTLWPVVMVLPENRPFEVIEKYWTGEKKSDTILDLSGVNQDTLFYTIKDPDSAGYERHTIEIETGSEKYTMFNDSSEFFLILDPLRKKTGRDSLLLTITDNGGHVKKIKKQLYYGYPPNVVALKNPKPDTVVESREVQFTWSCSDPDNELLHYEFSLFFSDGSVIERAVIQDTFFTDSGLKRAGVYYWNVVAHDSKSSTESGMHKLNLIPPDKVRFDTVLSKLPELIKCNSEVIAPIVVRYGYPPFYMSITQSVQSNTPQIRNDSIIWKPDCIQAGKHYITLEVKDSVGNSDAFSFQTSVYGSDSLTVSLVNTVPRDGNGKIDLSNPLVKEVVCTLSINDPDPSPPDSFTVEVMLGNVRQEFYTRSADRFITLSLKPDPVKQQEALSVKVTEMRGKIFTYTDSLYYGN
jgi:hypothetical protein